MILDQLRQDLDGRLGPWAKAQGLNVVPSYALEEPPAGIEADLACNLALLLAKPLKKSPRALAEELKKTLDGALPMVDAISVAGAGFVNFHLTLSRLQKEIATIVERKAAYGRLPHLEHGRVLIEFVSANPTGPLHVGHGRGAALGDSLALILTHLGYTVTREYYINDAGNQVQMLGESVLVRASELEGKSAILPENGYHGDYVKDLAKEFLASPPAPLPMGEGGLAKNPSPVGRGRQSTGEAELKRATAFAVEHMLANIKRDLEAFGVRFDSWFSEAGLVKKGLVEKYIEKLKQKGCVEEYEDAVWFVAPGEKEEERDKNRVLKKRDGKWTYFATDIAYHAYKYEQGYDRLIDIWGADHHGYVPRVKGSMQSLGHDANKLHVILNQMVALTRNGVPVVMSKRAGEFVTLREVVEEVGKDACRFFFAMRGPNSALEFDLELAKKHSNDNPVFYLQYAHARICSIFRQAPSPQVAAATATRATGEGDFSRLIEKEERDLMKRLSLFTHTLLVCEREDSPHPLTNYLLALCRQFHHFYDHHRVLGDDSALTQARLGLLEAVRTVLALGLSLLGVSAPESM